MESRDEAWNGKTVGFMKSRKKVAKRGSTTANWYYNRCLMPETSLFKNDIALKQTRIPPTACSAH